MREMLSKVVLAILNGTLRQVARGSLACLSMLAPSPSTVEGLRKRMQALLFQDVCENIFHFQAF